MAQTRDSMRTTLTHALFFFLPALANAQGLTNGQVYDYDPGDVFLTTDYWCANGCFSCPPALYVRDSVIDKQFNVGGYQVLYTIQQQRYRAPGGPFQAEDTTLVIDFGITDTTAYPEHHGAGDPGFNCEGSYVPTTDTVLSNTLYCGRLHWWQRFEPCDTCFCFGPPSPWSSRFVLGCGGPYWDDNADFPSDVCSGVALTYYNKGGVGCGNDLTMGMNRPEPRPSFTVFPDPADDVLGWSGVQGAVHVEVHSLGGGSVLRARAVDRIDVSMLSPGLYALCLTGSNGRTMRARFIKR